MPDISKTDLNKEVKRYIDNNDLETAKNLINSFGPQIDDFNVEEELEKIKKLTPKEE